MDKKVIRNYKMMMAIIEMLDKGLDKHDREFDSMLYTLYTNIKEDLDAVATTEL